MKELPIAPPIGLAPFFLWAESFVEALPSRADIEERHQQIQSAIQRCEDLGFAPYMALKDELAFHVILRMQEETKRMKELAEELFDEVMSEDSEHSGEWRQTWRIMMLRNDGFSMLGKIIDKVTDNLEQAQQQQK